jgi:hypothetical protein
MGGVNQMIYTTHPFLIALYLNCSSSLPSIPLSCPNQTSVDSFVQGINEGRIAWHAFPFNSEPELLDSELMEYYVSIAQNLDAIFPNSGNVADTMSQRDVPGMTRAVVPLLNVSTAT